MLEDAVLSKTTHLCENSSRLNLRRVLIRTRDQLITQTKLCTDVCILRLPAHTEETLGHPLEGLGDLISEIARGLDPEVTLITIGEVVDLVHAHAALSSLTKYHLWIAIKRKNMRSSNSNLHLPQHHFGALIHANYKKSLRHAKTRIRYIYCPACDKTTKDYGGKKHTYHEFGTLLSDIWRHIACDLEGDLTTLFELFTDLFGIQPYQNMHVLDCRRLRLKRSPTRTIALPARSSSNGRPSKELDSQLIWGDCLKELRKISDNSVDFAFADPPYNLRKKYSGYEDDLQITEYFRWCDEWIAELARVLRPGRTCAVLNIPLWSIRHFLCLEKTLRFQNWIAWDALSFPVRLIMPSHYAILCFSKGKPRELPGLSNSTKDCISSSHGVTWQRKPLAEGYCLRASCVADRRAIRLNDRGSLTDLWWDIHRLKHNSRRVDHPCQLPPQLMYRLISIFTKPGEIVLDCFDGAGTTTLAAHQLDRKYIGIEMSKQYYDLAYARHKEIVMGYDPFRKAERVLLSKNSPVHRMPKQKYLVPKKTLQLEVKRIAGLLGHLPAREEVQQYGKYPIEYYDKYFASWGEVCAAARTTGMTENRRILEEKSADQQLELFESKAAALNTL